MDDQTSIQDPAQDNGTTNTTPSGEASVLVNLEQLIKNHIASIDRVTEESKRHKDMLDDIFDNDPTYREHAEAAKEAAKIKSATKAEIMKQPQVFELSEKVKSMRSEIKELKAALSDYLQEYRRMSGVSQIEDDQGEVREIVYTAKLVKLGSQYRP